MARYRPIWQCNFFMAAPINGFYLLQMPDVVEVEPGHHW
jgi:hypothetical protein